MRLRSLLFVPGDSEKKFVKACDTAADILILDLEDAVAPSKKGEARALVSGWLEQANDIEPTLFVRINPLDTDLTLDDLSAVVKPGLSGLLIPKSNGGHDIDRIGHYLDALETRSGMDPGSVRIAVVATETAEAMFNLGSYNPANPRLVGLTWGAEDLAAAIGATGNKEEDGNWTAPYLEARNRCLYAAANVGVIPIDTLYADFRDEAGLERDCIRARRDGFLGRIAIHPAQVEIINRCFSPSPGQLTEARKIVDAFAANPDAGTLGIDGKMYDIPHLKAAQRTLKQEDTSDE